MNKSGISTAQKLMVPLRIPAELYQGMVMIVRAEKDHDNSGYSMNQYITELIEKDVAQRLQNKIKY